MRRIAVYSIVKDEVYEVAGWEKATRGADFRLLFDTGSTDGTDTEAGKFADVTVVRGVIKPWRFDDARNAALALIPADIDVCVSLDMDERLRGIKSQWFDAIQAAWQPDTGMLRCPMHNGGVHYNTWRIHSRFGWRWRHPVHEILHWRGETPLVVHETEGLVIDHFPLLTKPRPVQRKMLEEAVEEAPQDARVALQYGWQLLVDGETDRGIAELGRYLELSPRTGVDAAFVHRLIAKFDDPAHRLMHLMQAEEALPSISNSIALADHYRENEQWQECYTACQAGIARARMRKDPGHWGDDDRIRTSWLHDTASNAAWMTWDFEASYGHAIEAYRRNPDQSRRENIKRIEAHIAEGATLENMPPAINGTMMTDPPKISVEVRRGSDEPPVDWGSAEPMVRLAFGD